MRLPTYKELKRFVEVEGWEDKDKVSQKKKGDHYRYVFVTPAGEILYTRISHGSEQVHSQDLFKHILRDQLCIDENQFWDAVDKGIKPKRPTSTATPLNQGIEAKLARNLLAKVGLSQNELADITQTEAVTIWTKWLSSGNTGSGGRT